MYFHQNLVHWMRHRLFRYVQYNIVKIKTVLSMLGGCVLLKACCSV